ncbi:MAG: aminotransferase class I/II-fold pyridoxal phosphate-dependent enzyme [Treponema sp.]|nr:aminotransferase class I/II-fold pyridoxal phosphate-dependent enzyme [Treponema sp.]
MSDYWNSRVINLSPYVPGEQPRDRQFIKLNTNENPYPPSQRVIEAIRKTADDRLRLYPDPECTEFREAVAARYGVKPENVFAGNGSDEILALAFGAFFESSAQVADNREQGTDGKVILFPDITYSFYHVYARLWGVEYRTVPLAGDFSVNPSDYMIPSAGIVLPNPNAPTGMALPLDALLPLVSYLDTQGKVFILDEAYCAFGAESALVHLCRHPNLLIIHTLSKSASLAGLRAGFAVGSVQLIEGLRRMRDSFNSYTVDRLAQEGAAAAITDAAYYDEINRRIIATRDRVSQELARLGFTVLPSQANFIFIRAPGRSGIDFFSFLRQRGILARHFSGERTADFLRVSIGTDADMDVFLDACQRFLI